MVNLLFSKVLELSLKASVIILAVLLLRLVLRRAPKVISYALWGLVLVRLLCPAALPNPLALLPQGDPVRDGYALAGEAVTLSPVEVLESGSKLIGDALNGGLGNQHIEVSAPDGTETETLRLSWGDALWLLLGYGWLSGVTVMALLSVVRFLRFRRKLIGAVEAERGVWHADHITGPFVVGIIRPRIYLPTGLYEEERAHVLAHERCHIRRGDHLLRVIAYGALTLHWFNPLVWLAFALSGKDMEMSCDEAVLRRLGGDQRADYSETLLRFAAPRRVLVGVPVAFGEGDARGRIKNIMSWKKPALWVTVIGVLLLIVAGVFLLTERAPAESEEPDAGGFDGEGTVYQFFPGFSSDSHIAFLPGDGYARYTLAWPALLAQREDSETWERLGVFTQMTLTRENFDEYFKDWYMDPGWRDQTDVSARIREENVRAWRLDVEGELEPFYLLLEQKNGDQYLAFGYESTGGGYRDSLIYFLRELEPSKGASTDGEAEPVFVEIEESVEYPLPGGTLRWTSGAVYLTDENGEREIIWGMPVWNAYLCDLTGDGIPEICATSSIGSGMVNELVTVFDYVTGTTTQFNERGIHDYVLEDRGGELVVVMSEYLGAEVSAAPLRDMVAERKVSGSLGFMLQPGQERYYPMPITFTAPTDFTYFANWGRAGLWVEMGLVAEDGTEYFVTHVGGAAQGVIENVPAGTYQVYVRNVESNERYVDPIVESFSMTGAMAFRWQDAK